MRNCICFSMLIFVLLFACDLYGETVEPAGDAYLSEDILFSANSTELDEQAKIILYAKADFLKKNPEKNIIIEGYCDEIGSESFNYALGLKRANSVREFLLDQGISQRRMDVVSYGEKQPVSLLPDEKARRLNRRVSIKIR